nr:MAG TPA: hypothetical protein [Caudoviricetes sp.]
MSIRCFVSCLTDLSTFGGLDRFISAVIDQRFIVRDCRLVARGYADLHAGSYQHYTKDIILELSYAEYAKKFIVNVFWGSEWLDDDGKPMTQGDKDSINGICSLDDAERLTIKAFQKECNDMLERLLYYYEEELKQVLHIED